MLALAVLMPATAGGRDASYPAAQPGIALAFPRDHGAHPEFRTEWWYITGWVQTGAAERSASRSLSFVPPALQEDNPSAFAPRQLLFAHAAIADPREGRLRHDQRARARDSGSPARGEDRPTCASTTGRCAWKATRYRAQSLARVRPRSRLRGARAGAAARPRRLQPQGPAAGRPATTTAGRNCRIGNTRSAERCAAVPASAWLDHEWSSEYLAHEAAGWDWIGINLDDGGALMAFRMRDKHGGVLWAAATLRAADGPVRTFAPAQVAFTPLRRWRSPRTRRYPVAMRVRAGRCRAGARAVMDDQELDSRATTGTIYWEGAVRALTPANRGRGYLELTGYWHPVRL